MSMKSCKMKKVAMGKATMMAENMTSVLTTDLFSLAVILRVRGSIDGQDT